MSGPFRFVALALLAIAGAVVLVWLLRAPTEAPRQTPTAGTETDPPLTSGEMSAEDESALLLGNLDPIGYDETVPGGTVRRTDGGAVFAFDTGREITVTPGEGIMLSDRFVLLTEQSGGFFLTGPDGREVYFSMADAGRRIEAVTPREAAEFYASAAGQIAAGGQLPVLDTMLDVVETHPLKNAVTFCLVRDDGLRLQGGTRLIGPLSVTTMTVGQCRPDASLLEARLDMAEAALADNR